MAKSEKSSLVLRKTSLVTRQRLIPEMACSTRTRTRDSDRFLRFSARVSSRRRGFFGLPNISYFRAIPLKAGVLMQDGVFGVSDLLMVSNLFVVSGAGIGLAQITHPPGLFLCNHQVLVGVGLLFAAVVQRLVFRTFRALSAAFRAVNDHFP